jgi:cytochrome c
MSTLKTALALAAGLALALPVLADVTPTAKTAPKTASGKPDPATEAKMKKTDCFTCHSVAKKVIGPAYKDVAKKYKGDPAAEAKLVLKVKNGGSGVWGAIPMAAHPNISDADLHAMVRWVLAQK